MDIAVEMAVVKGNVDVDDRVMFSLSAVVLVTAEATLVTNVAKVLTIGVKLECADSCVDNGKIVESAVVVDGVVGVNVATAAAVVDVVVVVSAFRVVAIV